jgi:glycosyltransferase involved in cell wall biosynthesis
MKILFVGNYGSAKAQGGCAGIFVERQARSLRDRGIVIEAFDIGGSHSPAALVNSWRLLRRTIRHMKPDLVHAQYGTLVSLASVLALHPTVITFSGSDLLPGASISLARTWAGILMSNVASVFARRVICVSEELRSSLWWRKRGVVVIPRGVDLNLFTPGPRDDARSQLGWAPDTPTVLVDGGRDWKNKGLDVAEAAVAIAYKEVPALELKVIRNIAPDEMPVWLRAADALICASRQEGSPNVVKESLACNLPVIGVDVGDVCERLAGVEPSEVVERTPEAIAKAIVKLIHEGRRSNGRQQVSAISLERVAQRIVDVYSGALGGCPVAASDKVECQ